MHDKDIRDVFAAFALAGLLSQHGQNVTDVATLAYAHADAMLAARGKTDQADAAPPAQ